MLNKIPRAWIEPRKLYAKFQLCKSFQSLRTQKPQDFFGASYWKATRKDPDPEKIPMTSLICVPNFKVISGLEVPQLEKPNDPPKATFGHVWYTYIGSVQRCKRARAGFWTQTQNPVFWKILKPRTRTRTRVWFFKNPVPEPEPEFKNFEIFCFNFCRKFQFLRLISTKKSLNLLNI
jgi:hypothetical protein